jgi:hypothetical protein
MIVKPTISFLNRAADPDLLAKVRAILAAMNGNINYPSPNPSLPAVQAACDEFSDALAAAGDGGKSLTSLKNQKRKALVPLVRALAFYVQVTCNGDYTMLLTSGFPTHQTVRLPTGALPMPEELKVSLGLYTGQLDGKVAPVAGALIYGWRLTTAAQPDVIVQSKQGSAANVTFAGLTPGVIYRLEANCIGTAGTSAWTGPAMQMVV